MFFESLESRRMMSAALNSHGSLVITGTDHDDVVSIRKRDHTLVVIENGTETLFDASKVRRIVANLGGGNDQFAAHTCSRKRMVVDGGDGDDDIRTGFGNDEINGGAGNDAINGSHGDDDLTGGAGEDIIDACEWNRERRQTVFAKNHPFGTDVIHSQGDDSTDRITHDETDMLQTDRTDSSYAWSPWDKAPEQSQPNQPDAGEVKE